MRRTISWLLASDNVYKQCWAYLLARGGAKANVMIPMLGARRQTTKADRRANVATESRRPAFRGDRTDKRFYTREVSKYTNAALTDEVRNFWPTFEWADNPRIVDCEGNELRARTYTQLRQCRLAEINLTQIGPTSWRFKPRLNGGRWTKRRRARLRDWIVSIIVCSPQFRVGDRLGVTTTVRLWNPLQLEQVYHWTTNGLGLAKGANADGEAFIALRKGRDRLLWKVLGGSTDHTIREDLKTLEAVEEHSGLTFVFAHPLTTDVLWHVDPDTAPASICNALDRQRKQQLRERLTKKRRDAAVGKIKAARTVSRWYWYGQYQTTKQIWENDGTATHYHQWLMYRTNSDQLNLFHEARAWTSDCPVGAGCQRRKETLEHLLGRGGGGLDAATQTIATRRAPPASPRFVAAMQASFGFVTEDHATAMPEIWLALTTVVMATRWHGRNETVHNGTQHTPKDVADQAWHTGVRQARAISEYRSGRRDSRTAGVTMWQCSRRHEKRLHEEYATAVNRALEKDLGHRLQELLPDDWRQLAGATNRAPERLVEWPPPTALKLAGA
ncbi:hypothetical protein PybrP1_007614, partial [[Pythium] brassicae (nom. inval.)]